MNYITKLLKNTVNDGKSVFLSYFWAFLITMAAFGVRVYFDASFGDRYFVTYVLTIPAIAIIFGYGPGIFAILFSLFLVLVAQPFFIDHSTLKVGTVLVVSGFIYLAYVLFLLVYIKRTIAKTRSAGIRKVDAVREIVRDQREIISLTESAMQRANDVIIIAKAHPEMSVVYVNQAFTSLTGYTSEEILGKTPKMLHGPKTDRNAIEQITFALKNGRAIRKDVLNYRKNGSQFWVELDIAPIRNNENVITHWISIQREITNRKEYEASLLWGQKQARLALEARSLFIAKMSHEMRTPMTGILGMATIALQQNDATKVKSYISAIHESSLALMKVLNDILDFSKLESGLMKLEMEEFNLSLLVGDIQKLFTDAATLKNIQLNCAYIGKENIVVVGDRFRLIQVISNLVGNAIKFTEIGTVSFSLNVVSEEVNTVKVILRVEDTGVGIPSHAQKDIMSSYAQVDGSLSRRYGGTGLGLSISSELLHQMNSKLFFHSEEAVGSEFYFSLDLPRGGQAVRDDPSPADLKSMLLTDPSMQTTASDLTGKNILLVEDNQINQIVVSEFLSFAKATVMIANNGIEALAMFCDNRFDAVLMDIQLPELDGYETTRRIRALEVDRSIPIIGISAGVSEQEISKALSSGMDDFLPKPLNPDVMIKALLRNIERA